MRIGYRGSMPIRPDQRALYPWDWPQLSRSIRFRRAGGRCERCGRPHAARVAQLPDGLWWDDALGRWRDERGRRRRLPSIEAIVAAEPTLLGLPARLPFALRRVVLATAHLDHDPTNNQARNLAALCGRCHLAHDRPEHRRRRERTLRLRRAIGDLFG